MTDFTNLFQSAKDASRLLVLESEQNINNTILYLADLIEVSNDRLLKANKRDLEKMDTSNPLYDRLLLTKKRLDDIADALRYVANLKSPINEILEERILPNGINLKKLRVPFGVIGVIYEARPNVTFDVFALCLKTRNACILKGGKDAQSTNEEIIKLIHQALLKNNIPQNSCLLLPATHEATNSLLNAVGLVDLCIPRGGKNLINFVRDNAKVPVIETGAGVVHVYFDQDGDLSKGKKIIKNAKLRRVSVCNALDTLLIHSQMLNCLPELVDDLKSKNVELHCDDASFEILKDKYPENLLKPLSLDDEDTEWMDYKMGIKTVESLDEAINHISRHGSGHSESIVTENADNAEEFCKKTDASCVYVNLPTSFTDGGEFGLGAEIGISTQKLGPRGPMGLSEITTYKYILTGDGQIRE